MNIASTGLVELCGVPGVGKTTFWKKMRVAKPSRHPKGLEELREIANRLTGKLRHDTIINIDLVCGARKAGGHWLLDEGLFQRALAMMNKGVDAKEWLDALPLDTEYLVLFKSAEQIKKQREQDKRVRNTNIRAITTELKLCRQAVEYLSARGARISEHFG
jgi:hypothetical protein